MKRFSIVLAFVLGITLTVAPLGIHYAAGIEPVQTVVTKVIGKKAAKVLFRAVGQKPATPLAKTPEIKPNNTSQNPLETLPKPANAPADNPAATNPAAKEGMKEGAESLKRGRSLEDAPTDPFRPFETVIRDSKKIEGLFTLYRNEKTGRVFAEIRPEQLDQNHLMVMTLESAIGEKGLYSGLPLGDFLFKLRRVNNTLQFVVPNTYFRADRGTPMGRSLERSFSDSVLQTLPIRSIHEKRKSLLVEMNSLLLGDLPGLSSALGGGGYGLDPSRSYISRVKNFDKNTEIETVFGFNGSGDLGGLMPSFFNTLPDSRAFDLRVRYSLSVLPDKNNGYRPRLADDRVGYFITAFQDFNDDMPRQPFVRYINRWQLEKQDPTATLSAPKEPIVFWIENTVPLEYRSAVKEGIEMWNQAFEQAGYKNAVVAKQMPNKADWDPADVRYNTIRWFNSTDAIFAMGPSRVNPLTGQILDADIVVDANFVRAMRQEYRTIIEQNQEANVPFVSALMGQNNLCSYGMAGRSLNQRLKTAAKPIVQPLRFKPHPIGVQDLCYGLESAQQFSMGAMNLSLMQNELPSSEAMGEYIHDFLRELIAHEVGHTLGLRHNFRGSGMLKPEELNNVEITRKQGLVGSVMDYNAVNLAPQGTKQGDYYTHVIGLYDKWAIEYGYSASNAKSIIEERDYLQTIASRSAEPALAYATDEDVVSALDPQINLFDMSGDVLTYAKWQMENARAMWQRVDKRYPLQGDGFNEVRVAFNTVFSHYLQNASFLINYVGGQSFNRSRYGDAKGRLPFEAIPVAEQRRALELIRTNVFDDSAFKFSPALLNKLAPSRWSHWGTNTPVLRLDYPIFENVLFLQSIVMRDLLNYERLARIRDGELKAPNQTLTIPELFDNLQMGIWGEVMQPKDGMSLSSLRRALQREYMNAMIDLVLRHSEAPEDARTVARYELKQLRDGIGRAMRKVNAKDVYTMAHLEEAHDRISKAIDAPLQGQ
jgi:Met-zincin/Domain of unknown function (DUF5117)